MAKTRNAALLAPDTIYGFDWWNTEPQQLQVLTVGFIASRHYTGELSFSEMLTALSLVVHEDCFEPFPLPGSWSFWPSIARSSEPYLRDRLGPIAACAWAEADRLFCPVEKEP